MNSIDKKRWKKLENTIALSLIDGIGPKRICELMNRFGSAEAILKADKKQLSEIPSVSVKLAERIRNCDTDDASDMVAKIKKANWGFFLLDDPDYPDSLKNIADPPPYLFYEGALKKSDQLAIAIVGSRQASESGLIFANNLGSALAQKGVTVISGMARGIDTAAHKGALEAGGRTIAVWGSSFDIIYPPENRNLAEKIIESGCLISEFLPGTIPNGPNFPRRNRIISGISQGIVIIEAAEKSGALSTANHALSQNREVFAVPGSPRSATSRGTNRLIKEGATLLTSVEDIFEALPLLDNNLKAEKAKKDVELTATEKNLIDLFDDKPIHIDVLSREMAQSVTDIMPILLALELKGIIKELSGKRYILS